MPRVAGSAEDSPSLSFLCFPAFPGKLPGATDGQVQAGNFFEADLWPVLFRLDDGNGARETEGIGDEGVLADGDEWLVPDDKEHTLGGGRADAALQIGKVTLHAFGNGRACLGCAEHIGQLFRGSYYFIDVVRVRGIRRNSQVLQRLYGLKPVEAFGHKNDVGMQGSNYFQAGINSAANFGLFLRVRRIIAVVGVSHEMILQAEGVDGFRQARRERHDALDWLGNANYAAQLIRDFPIGWGWGRDRWSALGPRDLHGEQRGRACGGEYASKEHSCEPVHRFPLTRKFHFTNKKAPRDTLGPMASLFLAKSAAFCGTGGSPGLRLFSRSQWRDRGRFTRPSPLPLPAS